MSDGGPRAFYTERIPAQFNRALDEQAGAGEQGAKLLEDMRAVNATLKVVVEAEDGGHFYLNVDNGRMEAGDRPARPPFLTLVHDAAAFERLEQEAGDSALGFLGGLAGMAGDIRLTRSRLANLENIQGSVGFEMVGDGGFSLVTHFGEGEPPSEPQCRISVQSEAYARLKSGELNPQDAFMGGQIDVEGDVQIAMQLALAILSPD
ncbi:MAG: SCP2 sterol-binding domain-containing protein [Myxococcota bacterium]